MEDEIPFHFGVIFRFHVIFLGGVCSYDILARRPSPIPGLPVLSKNPGSFTDGLRLMTLAGDPLNQYISDSHTHPSYHHQPKF